MSDDGQTKRGPKGGVIGVDDPEELGPFSTDRQDVVTLRTCPDCGSTEGHRGACLDDPPGLRSIHSALVEFVPLSRALSAERELERAEAKVERLRETVVGLWHTSTEDTGSLHETLGMTWAEYGKWVVPAALADREDGDG